MINYSLPRNSAKKNGRVQWVKVRSANHYLDCMVYSLAMIDGGWQPSLKIMAAHIRQARAQKAASASTIEKFPHQTPAAGMKPVSNYSRPDMESIRERLADRRGRQ